MKAWPLKAKVYHTANRITDFYNHFNGAVYVSFSGGKDSTVLLHIARTLFPSIPAVYINTGLEYPEIRSFVRTIDNVEHVRPAIPFYEVLNKYGYPVISKEIAQKVYEIRTTGSTKLRNKRLYGDEKGNGRLSAKWHHLIDAPFPISHHCCNVMKKAPIARYERRTGRKPIIGTMTGDSALRNTAYLKKGCNSFTGKRPMSTPLAFWSTDDIWAYIAEHNLPYSSIYDKGYKFTGCMFCLFGIHLDSTPNRFQLMSKTHPSTYDYCINKLDLKTPLEYLNIPYKENDHA